MMSKKNCIVPFGWKRVIEAASSSQSVTYISPSGAVLASIVEVCQYLEKGDTCKCGLRCPIHVPKVFSFNPDVQTIDLSEKEWCQQENKTESHRKNCQHWNKLQKTQIGKKKAPCHSELTIEPPPKLLIIRKDGQLRSVIPDKRKPPSGAKKSTVKDIKPPLSPSSATSTASRKSSVTSLISPLFETGVPTSATGKTRPATKSKNDFKLQWIKADDEVSQNDGESGNELCFSPDSKKSPLHFPQSLVAGLSSPPSLFKQEGQFAMPSTMHQRALFVQGTNNAGLPSLHGGVEPVHRFGMSAFPGSNFVLKNDPTLANPAQSSFPQEIRRHSLMAVKSEQGQQFNQPQHFGFPTSLAQAQSRRFVQPGVMQDPHGGMPWQHSQNSQVPGNVKQMNSTMSGVRHRSQLGSPTAPQQFPLGSPTVLNPTSPFGFQMGNSGQNPAIVSPGQSTDPSPFSNRPLSRSSSIGTPAPSPGGHWQGARPQIPDYSRPHSRSSNPTTPGPDASPSQWNSGNVGMYTARNPGAIRGFTPNISPGPRSPFSPTRLCQSSNSSGLPMNPRNEIPNHGFHISQSASQQLRFHSQNVQQRAAQQGKNVQAVSYQTPQTHFGASGQLRGRFQPPTNPDQDSPALQGNNAFQPCPQYHPTRIQYARINETNPIGNPPRFPFMPSQTQVRHMQYQGQVMHQRFGLDPQQYNRFHGPLPTVRPNLYMQPGVMNPALRNPLNQPVRPTQTKPKRTRKKRTKQPVVKKSEPQQQTLNTNFMSAEFPDLFGPTQMQPDVSEKITNSLLCTTDNMNASLHKQDFGEVSCQSTNNTARTTRIVNTPNLVMPSTMQSTQTGMAGLTTSVSFTSSALMVPKPESASVSESQPTEQESAHQLDLKQDQTPRGVTTPPLPVLSPTCLFEEAHKGDDDEDDFSDLASPAVFDFPLAVPNTTGDANCRKSAALRSSLDPIKVTCSSIVSVCTANITPTPIISTMVKQPMISRSTSDLAPNSTFDSENQTTLKVSNHSNVLTGSHCVQYDLHKPHTVKHDSTSLVSSSGKIFHLPHKTGIRLPRRRYSDHGQSHEMGSDLAMRRRLRSDPYPSIAGQRSENGRKQRPVLALLPRESSSSLSKPRLSPISAEIRRTSVEARSLDSETVAIERVVASQVQKLPIVAMTSSVPEEHADATKMESVVRSPQITCNLPRKEPPNHALKTSEENIVLPCNTSSPPVPVGSTTKLQSHSSVLSESKNSVYTHSDKLDATAVATVPYQNDPFNNILEPSQTTAEKQPGMQTNSDSNRQDMQSNNEIETDTAVGMEMRKVKCDKDTDAESMQGTGTSTTPATSDAAPNNSQKASRVEKSNDDCVQSDLDLGGLDKVLESKAPACPTDTASHDDSSNILASEQDSTHSKGEPQQQNSTTEESAILSPVVLISPLPNLGAQISRAMDVDLLPDADCDESRDVSDPVTTTAVVLCEKESNSASDMKSSSPSPGKKINSGTQCTEAIESNKDLANFDEIEILPSRSVCQDLGDAPESNDMPDPCVAEDNDSMSLANEPEKLPPAADCEVFDQPANTITDEETLADGDCSVGDCEHSPKTQNSEDENPGIEKSITESSLNSGMEQPAEENVVVAADQKTEEDDNGPQSLLSADLTCSGNVDSVFQKATNTSEKVATCTLLTSKENSGDGIETYVEKAKKTGFSRTETSGLDLVPSELPIIPCIAENVEDMELTLTDTETLESQEENSPVLAKDTVRIERKLVDDAQEGTQLKTEALPFEAEVEQHVCLPNSPTIAKTSTSNSCQAQCPVSSSLAISPDLTNTVIRQLSNYNTILKNLLVSGVGGPATIAQLTSAASEQDKTGNKVISALINNTVQKLLKEGSCDDSVLVSSSAVRHVTQSPCDDQNLPSTSGMPKAISDVIEKPSTQISGGSQILEPVDELATEVGKRDVTTVVVTETSQSAMHPSPNHGLQVPIVSSSVKGSSQSEEEDSGIKTEVSTVSAEEQKLLPQNEVSTSVKGSVTREKQAPELIVIAQSSILEKRRARTRNATSKQHAKRPERSDVSEKATKRGSGSTGSSSSTTRTPQRISSERQNRNVKSGDLIWGQMRGFPSWPGKVVKPSEVRGLQQRAPLSEGKVWVKWFGDHTFTQMNPVDLVSMTEGLEAHHRSRKKGRTRTRKISAHLETAIQEAVDELEQQQGSIKRPQVTLVPIIPLVQEPTMSETTEKPRRGRKRKTT